MKLQNKILAPLFSLLLVLGGCNTDTNNIGASNAQSPSAKDTTVYTNQSEAGSDNEVVDNNLAKLKNASAPEAISGPQPTSFAGHSRQELIACLGTPARSMTISEIDYLSYVESTCEATYTIENDQVKEVIYTSSAGQPLTDTCVIAHGKCHG